MFNAAGPAALFGPLQVKYYCSWFTDLFAQRHALHNIVLALFMLFMKKKQLFKTSLIMFKFLYKISTLINSYLCN